MSPLAATLSVRHSSKKYGRIGRLWSRFSLTEEEEVGAEVSKQNDKEIHKLAGRFFTKWVLNVEAVGHTFKPLWKLIGELKIRDLGDNILFFDFEDGLDLERVLTMEPWTYDKHMVVFERAAEIEAIPRLDFNKACFGFRFIMYLKNPSPKPQLK